MLNDPFTSAQQKQRDQYELNDTDWYEVSFKEILGKSTCKLALHKDWMAAQGIEKEGDILGMNLPEQGIAGPFAITSIKHILPQKKPDDENPDDDYEYRPVTGIFVHESDDVWTLHFTNGDSLGVTANHPIYSASANGWRLAGELQVGEEVLAKDGNVSLLGKEKRKVAETVYNLEVRGEHNFLVGIGGSEKFILAHNSCIDDLFDLFDDIIDKKGLKHILRGEINGAGKATGVHHISAINMGTAKKVTGTETPGPNGLYKAKVEVKDINGNWIAKTNNGGYSTFFPDSWNQVKVMDEIKHAKNNKSHVSGNEYMGFSTDGTIEIHMYLKSDGTIISAFPQF